MNNKDKDAMGDSIRVVLAYLQKQTAHTVTEIRKSKEDKATQTKAVEKLLKDMVTTTLPEYKGKVYAVGGYVRDKMLNTNPKDIDLVVDSPEDDMKAAEIFTKKLGDALGITTPNNPAVLKEQYGIWTLALVQPREKQQPFVYDGIDVSGYVIEMTPPRLEGPYIKGRGPSYVKYTTLEDDAKRRDLTVNAIYQDVASGEIKDFVGGVEDLKKKILKPPPHPGGMVQIYKDDPLRIFRIIRFKGKLPNFEFDPSTEEFIKRFAKTQEGKEIIKDKVKPERIREELNKILEHPDGNVAAEGLDLMRDMGVLDFVSPTLSKMLDVYHDASRKWHHGENVWEHTLDVIKKTPGSKKARLAALFHDIGKLLTEKKAINKQGKPVVYFAEHAEYGVDLARKALKELTYDNEDIDSITKIIHSHMAFTKDPKTPQESSMLLRTFLQCVFNDLDDALAVIEADQALDDTEKSRIDKIKQDLKRLKDDDIKKGLLAPSGGSYRYIDPMSGDEIMAEFSEVTKGPVVGEIKAILKKKLLEGHFDNMDERQRAAEARKILGEMASRKGWEKILKNKVDSEILQKTKKKQEDREKGLPLKAPPFEELV
jgi:tRNA nucleotidyltransferase (CCA-adding enzyme)